MLLWICCLKSSSKLQALVASLQLSEMCSIVLTLQIEGGMGRFRVLPEVAAHRELSLMLALFSFSLFCGHPRLSRAFQHAVTTLRSCSKNKLHVLFSLTRAPLGSSAHSLIADAHDAWLAFRRKSAINTQQLCKYSQLCRCLPTASNTPYWVLEPQSSLLFSL